MVSLRERHMKLGQLLKMIQPLEIVGKEAVGISGVACDSRKVQAGMLFFALPGVKCDGYEYLPQALEAGAVAVVAEQIPDVCAEGICYIRVANARRAMAVMAAEYYGQPTVDVPVIGVTGTNGKTTTTYLLEAIFKQAGYSPAVFGTIECRFGKTCYEASITTPESLDLMRMMAEFRQQGADVLILEVSSHALEQHRVDGIHFDAAIFTNLTQDHLDYHETFARYFASKRRLFVELLGDGVAIINREDSWGLELLKENPNWASFGLDDQADVYPLEVTVSRDQICGTFASQHGDVVIESGMIGDFNVSNLLGVVATAQQLGISNEDISKGIMAAPQVPGRVEKVQNNQGVLALVDYSHTPGALDQALKTLSKLDPNRLFTIVGCGGDRDKGKRPLMAAVAVKYSNLSIFTSDNPRTEDPIVILEQMRGGAVTSGSKELSESQAAIEDGFIVIPDRRAAIEFACRLAGSGDLLLVAGKGHEDYQIVGTEKKHFDDREELTRVLNTTNGSDNQLPDPGGGHHV
ncbi:UDP-N-acetylmuramoyl-L-alanyl-D-glutamate--2,6-diaminopimelate ligase [uncultured Desulfuromusa sp.]|uniref:UDP-N-acetylmuramoyl-L-alanyl-D-glutamate--2, 6-diaminopimelate ligase n=1 Tax=uncultured Desulfuromusa sp. TaxID=219183 RepID=UPI002AA847A6|nr:UDP-N-acetylmuramoyl-L-alanyl-D-glutamate--2,6-diaminopimelate ligase [uncultured Desulfuromusa sp.]